MPPSSDSPGLRALTNMTRSCCLGVAGKPRSRRRFMVAQPSEAVGCSLVVNWLYGTAVV